LAPGRGFRFGATSFIQILVTRTESVRDPGFRCVMASFFLTSDIPTGLERGHGSGSAMIDSIPILGTPKALEPDHISGSGNSQPSLTHLQECRRTDRYDASPGLKVPR
jgi:hypothetical protein